MVASFRYLLLSLILSLPACEVGPDYSPPKADLPDTWLSQSTKQSTVSNHAWWLQFNDPVLNQLIDRASANNLDLLIATARIGAARSVLHSADAAFLPTGDVKGTALREANQIAFPGNNTSNIAQLLHKPFNMFQTGFDASWELDLFGGNKRADEAAEAQVQAAEASRDDAKVSLSAEVARTYITLRKTQGQSAIAEAIIAANQKTLQLAIERFNAGETSRLEVTQAEATLEQSKQKIPALHSVLDQSGFALDILLGDKPGASRALVEKMAPIPLPPRLSVAATPAAVIADRPDLKVAERKLAAATAQQGVALAKFFPNISLTGFFGALSTSGTHLINGGSESWMLGSSVLWPILSYGSLSANLDAANAAQNEAMATYRKSVITALGDVEQRLSAYEEQNKSLRDAEAQLNEDRRALRSAQERYKGGLTSRMDVLQAEGTAKVAEDNALQARADTAQDLIALYKSLGGGWKE